GQGMKELPFPAAQSKDRNERDQHNHDGEEDRPSDGSARRNDQAARVPGYITVAEMLFQVMGGVFGHDDGLVNEDADGNGDAGQGHDVGLDVDDAKAPQEPHQKE